MKKAVKFIYPVMSVLAIMLEALPYGAVLCFGTSSGEVIRETYSYFDPITWGYANFLPMITAIFTCVILVLGVIYLFIGKCEIAILTVSAVAFVMSICPLVYGVKYYSLVGAGISLILCAEFIISVINISRKSIKKHN